MKFRFELATKHQSDTITYYSALNEAKNVYRETILVSNIAVTSYTAAEPYMKRLNAIAKVVDNHTTSRKFKN